MFYLCSLLTFPFSFTFFVGNFYNAVYRPAASNAQGSLLTAKILCLQLRPPKSESYGWGAGWCIFNKPPRRLSVHSGLKISANLRFSPCLPCFYFTVGPLRVSAPRLSPCMDGMNEREVAVFFRALREAGEPTRFLRLSEIHWAQLAGVMGLTCV